jgi:hypothetical protein
MPQQIGQPGMQPIRPNHPNAGAAGNAVPGSIVVGMQQQGQQQQRPLQSQLSPGQQSSSSLSAQVRNL